MVLGLTNEAYEKIMRDFRRRLSSLGISIEKFEELGYTIRIDDEILKYYHDTQGLPKNPPIYLGKVGRKEVVLDYRKTFDRHPTPNNTRIIKDILYFRELLRANKIPIRELHSKRLEEVLRG